MHKKIPKICTGCRFSAAKIYLHHSTEIAKAWPGFDEIPKKLLEYSKLKCFDLTLLIKISQ